MSEDKYLILVVDDEPDMHALSRLSLKNLKYKGQGVTLAFASTGAEAVTFMQEHPETAVILLDVVMETSSAGLDACERIRAEIGNAFYCAPANRERPPKKRSSTGTILTDTWPKPNSPQTGSIRQCAVRSKPIVNCSNCSITARSYTLCMSLWSTFTRAKASKAAYSKSSKQLS